MSTRPTPETSWLVVVDVQQAFVLPGIPWSAGEPARRIIAPIQRLVRRWGPDRTIFTRYIAREGKELKGAWVEYFRDPANAYYNRDQDDPLWDIIPELASDAKRARVVSMPSFGKWGNEAHGIRALLQGEPFPELVVTGLTTECCVWSTATAAAEEGAHVVLVSDACATSEDEVTDFVWSKMKKAYHGLIHLASTQELLGPEPREE